MEINENQWKSKKAMENQRTSKKSNENQWNSLKINENQWIWLGQAKGRKGSLGRLGKLLGDNGRQQWRSLSRYLQISAVISSGIPHAPKLSAGGFTAVAELV